jgi:hypothetical protein
MSSESDRSDSKGARRALGVVLAAIGIALAGPLLSVVLPLLLVGLMLCACTAALAVLGPVAIVREAPQRATSTAEAHAAATAQAGFQALKATATAYPLPADVETFIEADDLSRWSLSPGGEYIAIAFWGQDRMEVMHLKTRQMRFVELLEEPAYYDAIYPDLNYRNPVWLDARRLFISQVLDSHQREPYAYRVFEVSGDVDFELHEYRLQEIRAEEISGGMLAAKQVYEIDSFHISYLTALALDKTGGLAIIAYSQDERQALSRLTANMAVSRVAPLPDWQFLERYPSPDGNFYASVWPEGARLAILRQGGDIVAETQADRFGPPEVTCQLEPIGWLPDSSGVLFSARCKEYDWVSQHAILILPVRGR